MYSKEGTLVKDVTQLFNEYRECVRNLWNIHFLKQMSETSSDWDVFERYDDVCSMLFASLVLNQVDREKYKKASAYVNSPEPLLFFRVIPAVEIGVPVNISREKNNLHYWDHSINFIKPNETDMRFIDFFDLDLLGFRDFQYSRIKIVNSNIHPELIEHDALIGCNQIKIFFDDTIL